jgi:hypothetical protein
VASRTSRLFKQWEKLCVTQCDIRKEIARLQNLSSEQLTDEYSKITSNEAAFIIRKAAWLFRFHRAWTSLIATTFDCTANIDEERGNMDDARFARQMAESWRQPEMLLAVTEEDLAYTKRMLASTESNGVTA